jgi:hypothetical protein
MSLHREAGEIESLSAFGAEGATAPETLRQKDRTRPKGWKMKERFLAPSTDGVSRLRDAG